MLVSVKIYSKKEVPLPKKGPNTKMTSWEVIAQVVLVSKNMAINFCSSYGGLFCPYGSQTKVKCLKTNAN